MQQQALMPAVDMFNIENYDQFSNFKEKRSDSSLTIKLDKVAKKIKVFKAIFMDRQPKFIRDLSKPYRKSESHTQLQLNHNQVKEHHEIKVFQRLENDLIKRRNGV